MLRILFTMLVAIGLAATTGCGCCANLFGSRTRAMRPIFAPAAPACESCNSCDSCGDGACGGGAMYGDAFSAGSYPAGPSEGYPMMMPPG